MIVDFPGHPGTVGIHSSSTRPSGFGTTLKDSAEYPSSFRKAIVLAWMASPLARRMGVCDSVEVSPEGTGNDRPLTLSAYWLQELTAEAVGNAVDVAASSGVGVEVAVGDDAGVITPPSSSPQAVAALTTSSRASAANVRIISPSLCGDSRLAPIRHCLLYNDGGRGWFRQRGCPPVAPT